MTSIMTFLKPLAIAAMLSIPAAVTAQNHLFEQMAQLPEVEYTYLSSAMLSKADDLPQTSTSINEILSQLNSIEVLTTESSTSYQQIVNSMKSLSSSMKLISRVQDDEETTQIFGNKSDSKSQSEYSEILFIKNDRDSEEVTVILFTGNIQPESIKDLID